MEIIASIVVYLICAIPFGLVLTKLFGSGADIRSSGSGNIGATNVIRTNGKFLGFLTFALDALKGFVCVSVSRMIFDDSDFALCVIPVIAVIGHIFPIYLNFSGGKGVATTFGAILGVSSIAAISSLLVWIIVFYVTNISSVAGIVALFIPFVIFIFLGVNKLWYLSYLIIACLVIYRHKENIQRLINGSESKIKINK
jgi:glycerol-3-phosphate acyltransferase PlsY